MALTVLKASFAPDLFDPWSVRFAFLVSASYANVPVQVICGVSLVTDVSEV